MGQRGSENSALERRAAAYARMGDWWRVDSGINSRDRRVGGAAAGNGPTPPPPPPDEPLEGPPNASARTSTGAGADDEGT